MIWLILIFLLAWVFCTGCEKAYDVAKDKTEKAVKNTYYKHEESIKKGIRETKGLIDFIRYMSYPFRHFKY